MKIRVEHVTIIETRPEYRPGKITWLQKLFRLPAKMQAAGCFFVKAYFVVNYMPPLNSIITENWWASYRVMDGNKNIIFVESTNAVSDFHMPEPGRYEVISMPFREGA